MSRENGRISEAMASLLFEETLSESEQSTIQNMIGMENGVSSYLGPVVLSGTNPIYNFLSGAHVQLDQIGNTTFTIANLPNGHTFSLYMKTNSISASTLALSSADGLRLISASSSSLLNPEDYEPNSHFIVSGTRRGDAILYLTSVYNALPVPTTVNALSVNFNGLNQPRVPNLPTWVGATDTLLRWYINDSVDVAQDDNNPYLGSLLDLDEIYATVYASNIDNNVTLTSNTIIYDAGAPSGGLLTDLVLWFEAADTTSKIGSSIISPTFGSTIAGPTGFTNAWDCNNDLSLIDGSDTAYQRTNLSAWTIAAVVRVDDLGTHYITQNHITILLLGDGKIRCTSGGGGYIESAGAVYTADTWHSIVLSHEANNTLTVYVDNVEIMSGSFPTTTIADPWYQIGSFEGLDLLQFVIADRAWDAFDVSLFDNSGNFTPFSTL